jgi:hypothetical protein
MRTTIGFAALVPLAVLALAGCGGAVTGALPYATGAAAMATTTVGPRASHSASASHGGHRRRRFHGHPPVSP